MTNQIDQTMKKLYLQLILFLSPFLLISLLVVIVDPYDFFNISNLISDDQKIKCLNRSNASSPRGNILWKTIAFRRDPAPNIILGDSRMVDINPVIFEKQYGEKVANLAIPAGNNKTIIDLFWMAARTTKLKNVFIQTNFNRYNALFTFDLYEKTRQLIDRPLFYFGNWDYIEDSFALLYYILSKDEEYVNQSFKYQKDNWSLTEKLIIKEMSEIDYIYPQKIFDDFTVIAHYCKENNINLQFIIAPDNYEYHSYIRVFKMEKEYERFKNDIRKLGNTIDLDEGLPFSFNKKNYLDHFHLHPEYADTIAFFMFHYNEKKTNRYTEQLNK